EAGKPVAGARVDFWCKGLRLPEGVCFPQPVTTGADGTFRALLPPGSWYLLVNGPTSDYVYQKIAADKLSDHVPVPNQLDPLTLPNTESSEKAHFYPDGWARLDVKSGQDPAEVHIALRRATLKGRLVSPDGMPIGKAQMVLRRVIAPAQGGDKSW